MIYDNEQLKVNDEMKAYINSEYWWKIKREQKIKNPERDRQTVEEMYNKCTIMVIHYHHNIYR